MFVVVERSGDCCSSTPPVAIFGNQAEADAAVRELTAMAEALGLKGGYHTLGFDVWEAPFLDTIDREKLFEHSRILTQDFEWDAAEGRPIEIFYEYDYDEDESEVIGEED